MHLICQRCSSSLVTFFHLHIRSVDLMKRAISIGESGARIPQDPALGLQRLP